MTVPTFRAGSQVSTSILVLCSSPLKEAFSLSSGYGTFRFQQEEWSTRRNGSAFRCLRAYKQSLCSVEGRILMVLAAKAIRWNSKQEADLAVTKKQDLDSNGRFQTSLYCVAIQYTARTMAALSLSNLTSFCSSVAMLTRSAEWEQKIAVIHDNECYADLVFRCLTLSEKFIVYQYMAPLRALFCSVSHYLGVRVNVAVFPEMFRSVAKVFTETAISECPLKAATWKSGSQWNENSLTLQRFPIQISRTQWQYYIYIHS
jgi:hypothetical protein